MNTYTQLVEVDVEVDVKDVEADKMYILADSGLEVSGEDLIADGVEGFVYERTYTVKR